VTDLHDLIGLRVDVEFEDGTRETGTVTGLPAWSEEYVLIETSRGTTCRNGTRLLARLHGAQRPLFGKRGDLPVAESSI
jgi:hypothetical protein